MWQFACDRDAGTVDIVRLRDADVHLNALRFLEPPPSVYLGLDSPPVFSGNVLDVDIGIRHPFLGLPEYTGFDACGILISHGSITGYASDPGIAMPGPGDTRMLNADGYTRWWNPTEFPPNPNKPIFGYKDGLLGTPDEVADFSATLNGYKYFADDIGPNDPVSDVTIESRGHFSAGQKNVRHYKIDMGDALNFNYAVDANWAYPTGSPPYQVPDDFPPNANRPEAWNVDIREIDNTLAFEDSVGWGHLLMEVDIYDWYDAGLNEVVAESLAGIDPVTASAPTGGGEGYSTYELDLPGASLTMSGEIELLITVRSEKIGYQGLLPGEPICAYFMHTTEVDDELPQGDLVWVYDEEMMLEDSIHKDSSPAIHQRTTYEVDIGYLRLEEKDPPSYSVANCHMLTSDNNGQSFSYAWIGNAYHYGQTLMSLKACQGPLGNSVFMYQSWLDWGQTPYQHASTARKPDFFFNGYQENEGIYLPWGAHANEVIWAADDKVLCFGDRDEKVAYKKGSDPYSLYYNHSWTAWYDVPETIISGSPAQLGETRCMVKDAAGAIHFAYFGGQDGVWIKMLTNSDGMGVNWDIDVYINEGFTDEYAARIEPSLVIDPDAKFHSAFIGVLGPLHSVLYTSTDDPTDWPGYNPIFTNPDGYIGEVTIDAFKFEDLTIIVISFEMGGDIRFLYSLDGGINFSDPVLISDGTGNACEPDIRADAQGYVHIAWSQFKEDLPVVDDYDIHYRRAHLEKQ